MCCTQGNLVMSYQLMTKASAVQLQLLTLTHGFFPRMVVSSAAVTCCSGFVPAVTCLHAIAWPMHARCGCGYGCGHDGACAISQRNGWAAQLRPECASMSLEMIELC